MRRTGHKKVTKTSSLLNIKLKLRWDTFDFRWNKNENRGKSRNRLLPFPRGGGIEIAKKSRYHVGTLTHYKWRSPIFVSSSLVMWVLGIQLMFLFSNVDVLIRKRHDIFSAFFQPSIHYITSKGDDFGVNYSS